MKRTLILAILAVFSLSGQAQAVKFAKSQVLRLGNGSEPRELDPGLASGTVESNIINNMFIGLTERDPETLEPKPGVAVSWTVSDDGTVYTFKLRKDALWSDNKPVTAHDFEFAWKRVLNPKLASEYAYIMYYIKNAKAFFEGKVKDPNQIGVKALDDHTLKVTLEGPTPFFIGLTAFYTYMPVPKHVVTKHPMREWAREGILVSNGAYKLAEWKFNKHVKVVKNDLFWDAKTVKVKEAYFYPTEDIDTEEKSFQAGELHWTNEVPSLKIPLYLKKKKREKTSPFRAAPALAVYFYRLNVNRKPLDDVRVRKALALAIDRKLIVERVTRAGQTPALSVTPPNVDGYTYKTNNWDVSATKEQVAKAQKLLAEAGYPNGKGFPKIEILYNTQEDHKKVAIAIQQMWKKNLNVNIGIMNQEWKVYLNSTKTENYDISRAGWIGDYIDPNTFLDMWITDGGQNNTGWGNKKYDSLITQASQTLDKTKRHGMLKEAEAILMDELPIIPIYYYVSTHLVSEKLKIVRKDGTIVPFPINLQDTPYIRQAALIE